VLHLLLLVKLWLTDAAHTLDCIGAPAEAMYHCHHMQQLFTRFKAIDSRVRSQGLRPSQCLGASRLPKCHHQSSYAQTRKLLNAGALRRQLHCQAYD
jgi:hypothetical protein